MPNVNLHSTAIGHPKIAVLSDGAFRLWIAGLSYCQNHLTDGFIPKHGVNSLGVKATGKWIDELLAVHVPGKSSLWHKRDGGYEVHDYLGWNDAAEDVEVRRKNLRDRVRRHRNKGRNVDGNALRNDNEIDVSNGHSKTTEQRTQTTEHKPVLVEGAGPRRRHPLDESPDYQSDPDVCERAERFGVTFSALHGEIVGARFIGKHERDWPSFLRLASHYTDREFDVLLRGYLRATGPTFDGKARTPGRLAEAAPIIEQRMKREGQWPNAA